MKKYHNHILQCWAILLSLLLAGGFYACDEDSATTQDIVPTATAITPLSDIRAGETVTIAGTDLDRVKAVRFGSIGLVIKDSLRLFSVVSPTELQVTLPTNASSGEVFLIPDNDALPNVATGIDISIKNSTLTNVSPEEVTGGTVVTLTGTALDLVQFVEIGGLRLNQLTLTAESDSTELTAVCSDEVIGGFLKIIFYNGESYTYPTQIGGILPEITSVPTNLIDPMGGEFIVNGTHLDAIRKAYIDEFELTIQDTPTATQLVLSYDNAVIEGKLRLLTSDGREIPYVTPMIFEAKQPTIQASTGFAGGVLNLTGTYLKSITKLSIGDTVIFAKDFINQTHTNITLYAPSNATAGRNNIKGYAYYAGSATSFEITTPVTVYVPVPTDYILINFDGIVPAATPANFTTVDNLNSSADGSQFAEISSEVTSEMIFFAKLSRPDINNFIYDSSTLSFAINVQEVPASTTLKWYLRVGGKIFYLSFPVSATNSWIRVDLPVSNFKTTEGESITEDDFRGTFSQFRLMPDTSEGKTHFYIDNIALVSGQ